MATQTRKITLDTAALFFGRAAGLLLGLWRLNYLTTYLGVEQFGILNFAAYFTALFQTLFDVGLSQLLIREIARDLSQSRVLLGRVLLIKMVLVIVTSALLTAVTFLSPYDTASRTAILFTTLAVAFNSVAMAFISAFQAHRKVLLISLVAIVNDAALSGAIILLLPQSPHLTTALTLTALAAFVNLALLTGLYIRAIGVPQGGGPPGAWKRMITEGIPFAFTSLGASVYMFVGPTVLKYARGDVEVGLYSAGYKLISILTLIPSTFTQVVYPVFAEFHAYATRKLEKALTDSLRAISLVSIPVAAGAWVIAPQLFAFLYEPPFRPGQMVFQVLTAANVVGYMNWVLNSYLLATRHQTFTMVLALVCGIFVTFASIVVLPGSGFRALPWIIVANELLLWISQIVFLARFGWWPFKWSPFLRQLLAAAVMVAVLLTIREVHFVLLIPVGALVYTLTLLACKGFGEQESAVLLGIVRWLSQKQPRG